MATEKWSEFWKQEKSGFFKIMKMSTTVFATKFVKQFQVDRDARILDFGCGPGFLIESLLERGILSVGLEINEFFVAECKRKFTDLSFYKIDPDKGGLDRVLTESLQNQKFDFIVLLSVSQYFDNKKSFQETLSSLKSVLKADGKIVIADVVTPDTSSIRDLLAVFTQSLVTANIFNLLGFLRYLFFSNYRAISKKNNLQSYTEKDFAKLTDALGLSYSVIKNLTLHPTRLSYILQT